MTITVSYEVAFGLGFVLHLPYCDHVVGHTILHAFCHMLAFLTTVYTACRTEEE